ncbi:MAG: phytoene/squalene synthase family protein [Kiloniellales bacterium]
MASEQDRTYCADLVRAQDRDRYLACLFAPSARRPALMALYAFNVELARTAEAVSEPLIGEIRLQWWRDALPAIVGGTPPQQPVAAALAAALVQAPIAAARLEKLIDARALDLSGEPPANLADLERYAEATAGALALLALELLGAKDEAARAAARALALAWALTGLLRAVPFHAAQRRLYLPADLSRSAGLLAGPLFELQSSDALRDVARHVAEAARRHLAHYRVLRHHTGKAAKPVLLPAVLCRRYLSTLATAGHDPFAAAVQAPRPGNVWRLAWAATTGRY